MVVVVEQSDYKRNHKPKHVESEKHFEDLAADLVLEVNHFPHTLSHEEFIVELLLEYDPGEEKAVKFIFPSPNLLTDD